MDQKAVLVFGGMAQVEASMTVLCIFLFVGVVFWRACHLIGKGIEQSEYERRRMFLMMAEELDRLDKALKESEKAKKQELVQPYKDLWHLRN